MALWMIKLITHSRLNYCKYNVNNYNFYSDIYLLLLHFTNRYIDLFMYDLHRSTVDLWKCREICAPVYVIRYLRGKCVKNCGALSKFDRIEAHVLYCTCRCISSISSKTLFNLPTFSMETILQYYEHVWGN